MRAVQHPVPMNGLTKRGAQSALQSLALSGPNRDVAGHWLSLWTADIAPSFRQWEVSSFGQHAEAIAIFAVDEETAICERAGKLFEAWLGFDLVGIDILSITPSVDRRRRHENLFRLLGGAISFSGRLFRFSSGKEMWVPEIGLPFLRRRNDEPGRILFHINWRPVCNTWLPANFRADIAISRRFRVVELREQDEEAPRRVAAGS